MDSIKKDWPAIILKYRASGLPQREFALQNGLNLATFQFHMYKKPKRKTPKAGFIPVAIQQKAADAHAFEIIFRNGTIVKTTASASLIRELLPILSK